MGEKQNGLGFCGVCGLGASEPRTQGDPEHGEAMRGGARGEFRPLLQRRFEVEPP
jgi:hypothetical protein